MTRIEERLRDSLAARAQDVQASPQLWEQVEERVAARRRRGWLVTAGAAAAVVGLAAVAVPRLLDDASRDRAPFIDSTPGDGTPSDGADDGPVVVGSWPDPTRAVAVQDGELVVVDLATATVVDGAPLAEGEVIELAVRPQVDPTALTVSVVERVGTNWQVRTTTFNDVDEVDLGVATRDEVRSVPMPIDVGGGTRSPGVAWSPDGRELAWVETIQQGDGSRASILQVQRWEGNAPALGDGGPQFLLADRVDLAGDLTLSAWTWDVQYEDGLVGRIFLTGEGRSFQAQVTRDADGSLSVGGIEPIDVKDDFDAAGPTAGVYGLEQRGDEVRLFPLEPGEGRVSLQQRDDTGVIGRGIAVANDVYVLNMGDHLVLRSVSGPEETQVLDNDRSWGPVDLIEQPWLPAFASADPAPEPSTGSEAVDPRTAVLPGFLVTTDGTSIDLRRSDGSLIQRLHTVAAEGESTIIGLDVRPGSSTEDLTVAYSTSAEGMVSAWSLRGRADDQAGLAVEVVPWDDAHQPSGLAQPFADGAVTVPVFSDDGAYVAYAENTGDGSTMRIFGWPDDADVPGTGRTADDNVGFDLGTVPHTLERFAGPGTSRGGGVGYVAEFTDATEVASACEYEQQADGALAEVICEADRAADRHVVDLTDTWLLERVDGGLELVDQATSFEAGQRVVLPLPFEVERADPATVWLTGRDQHGLVGIEGRAWLVTADGAQELEGTITWAAGIR